MNNFFSTLANDKLLKNKSKFTIKDSAFACVMFIVFSIVFSIAISFIDLKDKSGTFIYFFIQAIAEILFAVAALVVVYSSKRDVARDTGLKNKINGKIIGLCFLVSLVSLICFGNLTNVFVEILYALGYKSILGNIEISTFGQYVGYLISSCCIAAFCEEFLFRGVILSGFRKYGAKIAIFASALIFMLMHGNAEQTVHQFIVGILIGWIFYVTGNFWIGFFIHLFNNFIPITEAFLLNFVGTNAVVTETAETTEVVVSAGTIVFDFLIALLLAWAGITFIEMIYSKLIKENEKLNGQSVDVQKLTNIVVDGAEQNVEMTIDGETSTEQLSEQKPKPIESSTIAMFILSGIYLVAEWIFATYTGFII